MPGGFVLENQGREELYKQRFRSVDPAGSTERSRLNADILGKEAQVYA
jgi:hypothetical protein